MAEEFIPENRQSSTPSGKAGFDSKEFKELIKIASHERKNLQLLVEYFEKKSDELEDKKKSFDRVSGEVPDALRKLDSLDVRFQEIKNFDVRVRDFQLVS